VQLLITGGVRSKPNSATGRGILVIDESGSAGPNTWGLKNKPTNPLGFEALAWRCEG